MIRGRSLLAACGIALGLATCTPAGVPPTPVLHGDGLDVGGLPAGIRAEYTLFAQRCSKCHALSRALNSGIADDEFWKLYVQRMRRQPASGISPEDEAPILRFLHHYSLGILQARSAGEPPKPGPAPTAPER